MNDSSYQTILEYISIRFLIKHLKRYYYYDMIIQNVFCMEESIKNVHLYSKSSNKQIIKL